MAPHLRRHSEAVVRITTATSSRDAEINARQRRYLYSMGVRTACFVTAIIVGSGWLMWVLIVGALVLPYIAVVMANNSSSRTDGFELRDGGYGRPELQSGASSTGATGQDDL